jgi:hypothetical protein
MAAPHAPDRFLFGVYGASLVIFLTAQLVALIIWRDLAVHVGLLAGFVPGIVPFASWHLIVKITDGFKRRDRIWMAVSLGIGKYGLLGAGLYMVFTRELANVWAFVAGMSLVLPVLVILGLVGPGPATTEK